jgi:hypothetical protein
MSGCPDGDVVPNGVYTLDYLADRPPCIVVGGGVTSDNVYSDELD